MVIDKDVAMKTRDGVTLRADVYRPDGPGRFPVLLSRLPYDKNLRRRPGDIDVFVERGYVVIIQDTRGRFASEGRRVLSARVGGAGRIRRGRVGRPASLLRRPGRHDGAVVSRRDAVPARADAAAASQGVVPGLGGRRFPPVLGVSHGRRLRAGMADPLRDPDGARHASSGGASPRRSGPSWSASWLPRRRRGRRRCRPRRTGACR